MSISVVPLEEEEGEGWKLKIYNEPVIISTCKRVCELNAQRLHRAYASSFAAAVEIVVTEIGFCRDEAIDLVQLMHQPQSSRHH